MHNWTDHISKGVLSLSVMIMLALALIAAQVQSGPAATAERDANAATGIELRITTESPLVDVLLALPIDVSFVAGPHTDNDAIQ